MIPSILQPDAFEAAQKEALESDIQIYPARAWYPSSLFHPCDRFQVWQFTRWSEKKRHSYVLQSIFNEGRLHQPDVYRRLEKIGFQVIREIDRPTQYKAGKALISGRVDGRLIGFREERFEEKVLLEVKSAQDHEWKRLDTIEDLRKSDAHYIRGYYGQTNLGAFLENLPNAAIVLKSKGTGLLKVLPFELDYQHAEDALKRVERLQDMVDAQQDPPPITYEDKICGRCSFLHVCFPAKDMGQGLQLFEDAQMLDDIERREALKEASKEYNALDKSIKTKLKKFGTFEAAAIGSYLIERKEVPVKAYSVAARTDIRFDIEKALDVKVPAQTRKQIE